MKKEKQHDYDVIVSFGISISNVEEGSKESILKVIQGMIKDDPEEIVSLLEIESVEDLGESKEQF